MLSEIIAIYYVDKRNTNKGYSPVHIFNVDESEQFCKWMPACTYIGFKVLRIGLAGTS